MKSNFEKKTQKGIKQPKPIKENDWSPCMHDNCPKCHGTGTDSMGKGCVHMLVCTCEKCSPKYF